MRIFLAGHTGMVGQAFLRQLNGKAEVITQTRAQLDLTNQAEVQFFMQRERPDQVIIAAAKVGGIAANAHSPATFIYDNLMIASTLIHSAFEAGVGRLLNLGSSCIYPKMAAQPMAEDALMTGALEPTNAPYAVAKIAAIKLCESYNRQYGTDFRSVMPTNLYGPGDNFHPQNSHVLPALLRRIHEAKCAGAPEVVIWGTGTSLREFMHVDDMAAAGLHVMGLSELVYKTHTRPQLSHINVGSGQEVSILELAQLIADVVGYEGALRTDPSKPDGAPRKLLDCSLLTKLGWEAQISLRDGIAETYRWYLAQEQLRAA